jgi:hypothetical protein
MNSIVTQKLFWSDNDDDVLKAIKEGYITTHYSMWREQGKIIELKKCRVAVTQKKFME